jgi:hypothetical protein
MMRGILEPRFHYSWDRKMLRRIYGLVVEQGIWRVKTDQELRELHKNLGGTALQTGRSQDRFLMVSLEFFIDIILPAALWP